MHGNQRKFHFYRETEPGQTMIRALCGKWAILRAHLSYLGPLQPFRPGALHIGPEDCTACSRRVRADEPRGQS